MHPPDNQHASPLLNRSVPSPQATMQVEVNGQIVDFTSSVYTVQLAGDSEKLDGFIQAVGTSGILEVVRTGVSGIARGEKVLSL